MNIDYLVVSNHCPDLYSAVKKIFNESGCRDIKVISADLQKSKKNN